MKTLVVIKEIRTITVKEGNGFRFIDSYACEVHKKNGTVSTVELRKAQLIDLYQQADKNGNIEFAVEVEELEEADLVFEAYSVEEVDGGEYDVYIQTYNFSTEVDFREVVSTERCRTFNKKDFIKFRKAYRNECWV